MPSEVGYGNNETAMEQEKRWALPTLCFLSSMAALLAWASVSFADEASTWADEISDRIVLISPSLLADTAKPLPQPVRSLASKISMMCFKIERSSVACGDIEIAAWAKWKDRQYDALLDYIERGDELKLDKGTAILALEAARTAWQATKYADCEAESSLYWPNAGYLEFCERDAEAARGVYYMRILQSLVATAE